MGLEEALPDRRAVFFQVEFQALGKIFRELWKEGEGSADVGFSFGKVDFLKAGRYGCEAPGEEGLLLVVLDTFLNMAQVFQILMHKCFDPGIVLGY